MSLPSRGGTAACCQEDSAAHKNVFGVKGKEKVIPKPPVAFFMLS